MNPMKTMKLAVAWKQFIDRHPKFAKFITEVPKQTFKENTVIDITITTDDGKKYVSNMKISAEDLAVFEELHNMRNA